MIEVLLLLLVLRLLDFDYSGFGSTEKIPPIISLFFHFDFGLQQRKEVEGTLQKQLPTLTTPMI